MRERLLIVSLAVVALSLATGCGEPCARESGQICTVAGTGTAGLGAEGELATRTALYLPQDITAGADGRLYLADWNNHRIRVTTPEGTLQTLIGTGELGDGEEGPALSASLNHPTHVAFDPNGDLVLSAWHNSKVMRYDFETGELVKLSGSGKRRFGGDGGKAVDADLDLPVTCAFREDGAMYIADQANARIRLVETDGIITTVVGTGEHGYGGDDGPAIEAMLRAPVGQAASPAGKMVADGEGNLFIADSGNNRVRRVDAETFIITTFAGVGGVAGEGEPSAEGDGGPAVEAHLARPTDVAVGPDGAVFIADTDNHCVRKVDAEGIISTVAGVCGQQGYAGDLGPAVEAKLSRPFGVEVDADGILYIADTYNHRVRAVYP